MSFQLFEEVAILVDIPEKKLLKGDVATIVEHHSSKKRESGYSLEVYNAVGETIAVLTLPESCIEPLRETEIFNVRTLSVS